VLAQDVFFSNVLLYKLHYQINKLCCRREAARCFVSVLASIMQYLERSLLLLVTSASDFTKVYIYVLFCSPRRTPVGASCHKQNSLMRNDLRDKRTSTLSAINLSTVETYQSSIPKPDNRDFCPPSEHCRKVWYGSTRMVWLPDAKKNLKMKSTITMRDCAIQIHVYFTLLYLFWHNRAYTNVTDSKTDRQTLHDGIGRAYA